MATGLGNYPSLIGTASSSVTTANNLITTDVVTGSGSYQTTVNLVPNSINNELTFTIANGNTSVQSFTGLTPGSWYQLIIPYNILGNGTLLPTAGQALTLDIQYGSNTSLLGTFGPVVVYPIPPIPIAGATWNGFSLGSAVQGTFSRVVQVPTGVTTIFLNMNWAGTTGYLAYHTTVRCMSIQKIG
jgi:hypothetical protein